MTGVEKFEQFIREFGVDFALEYFATPKHLWPKFDDLRKKEEPNEPT